MPIVTVIVVVSVLVLLGVAVAASDATKYNIDVSIGSNSCNNHYN